MDSIENQFKALKKNRATIMAVLALTVAFCCIFALVGNKTEQVSNNITGIDNSVIAVSDDSSVEDASSEVIVETQKGVGIYVDGCFVAAVEHIDSAKNAFRDLLAARVAALNIDSSAENSFVNNIEYVDGEYSFERFCDEDGVYALISDKVSAYNGDLLPIKFSVKSVSTHTENVVLEYETKTIYTDSLKDGVTKQISKGYNGEGVETTKVVSVDGVEIKTEVVSLDVTSAAVDAVVRVGTRSDGLSPACVMNFIKPYDGVITYYCGPRWGTTHKGLDIAQNGGCYRHPAVAAADGVVIQASNTGNGYGNCVIIDHGNGITTLYAHFDECVVSVGDEVKAGDVVGLIGNTGYSFGNHLHFEVRINGEFVNPLLFVDYD